MKCKNIFLAALLAQIFFREVFVKSVLIATISVCAACAGVSCS